MINITIGEFSCQFCFCPLASSLLTTSAFQGTVGKVEKGREWQWISSSLAKREN